MTQHQIARLCFKVLAVYAVITGIGNGRDLVWAVRAVVAPFAGMPRPDWPLVFGGLFPVVQIALGAWLWWKAGVVAAWVTGRDLQDAENEPTTGDPWTVEAAHVVVIGSLGVWTLISAIPDALRFVVDAFLAQRLDERELRLWTSYGIGQVFALVARLGIGVWLTFGASGIAAILRRLGTSGRDGVPRAREP